jgi:hypothetical protein
VLWARGPGRTLPDRVEAKGIAEKRRAAEVFNAVAIAIVRRSAAVVRPQSMLWLLASEGEGTANHARGIAASMAIAGVARRQRGL